MTFNKSLLEFQKLFSISTLINKMEFCNESSTALITQQVKTPLGIYTVKACSKGVHHLALTGVTDENFDPDLSAIMVEVKELDNKEKESKLSPMKKAETWLHTYFTSPSNLPKIIPPVCFPSDSSTEFERKVWSTLGERVLCGETITYAGLAGAAINNPKASRAVGTAMKKNPVALIIPCHRVIRSNGQMGNYAGGKSNLVKKWLLEHEQKSL